MCNTMPTAAGREPDYGDGVTIYRHTYDGFVIRTHRTVRVSPAGWVFGVYDESGAQYTYGYTTTQREALSTGVHYIMGVCEAGESVLDYGDGGSIMRERWAS